MTGGSPFTQLWKQSEQKREVEEEQGKLKVAGTPTPTPTPTPIPIPTSISPEKNFTKVANSIKPEIFRGTSQKTYMALYRLTRGAIVPKRIIKITRNDLMAYADVSEVTLVKHLTYLEKIARLIQKSSVRGDNDGATYEVFMPEEVGTPTPTPTPTSIKKVDGPPIKKVGVGVGGNLIENITTYDEDKTFFKTNTKNDDEAFAAMLIIFKEMCKKISGKSSNENQKENWQQLAELLKMELEIAAARTKSVSNVPAFLTEHLRRRLLGKAAMLKSKASNSLQVGKANDPKAKDTEEYQAEPLSKEGRETVLKTMREYLDKGQNEFIMSFQDTYTQEDWDWLTQELKQENSSKRP